LYRKEAIPERSRLVLSLLCVQAGIARPISLIIEAPGWEWADVDPSRTNPRSGASDREKWAPGRLDRDGRVCLPRKQRTFHFPARGTLSQEG